MGVKLIQFFYEDKINIFKLHKDSKHILSKNLSPQNIFVSIK